MPSGALDTFTKLINSPPGVLAAGAVLAGIVWKFFERVEAVLTDQTKLEIAVWLVGAELGKGMEPWPNSFAKTFDRIFGSRFVSWRCFLSSGIASVCLSIIIMLLNWSHEKRLDLKGYVTPRWPNPRDFVDYFATNVNFLGNHDVLFYLIPLVLLYTACGNIWFDYLSLGLSKLLLRYVVKRSLGSWRLLVCILGDACCSAFCGGAAVIVALFLGARFQQTYPHRFVGLAGPGYDFVGGFDLRRFWTVWFGSAFFTSIWLWLYAGSGFILKAARRFDIGFAWFNRHFDIEKKPLQSIGLVAGAIVAVVYWTAVVVMRVV